MDRNEIYQKKDAFASIEKQEVLLWEKKGKRKNETAEDVRVTGERSDAKKTRAAEKKAELKPEVTVRFEGRDAELAGVT